MSVFSKITSILGMLLVVVIIWVGLVIYLNYSEIEIKGDFIGIDVDETYTLVDDELDLGDNRVVTSLSLEMYTNHIDSDFDINGFNNLTSRIENALIIEPQIFHDLQSDAVIEGREQEQTED